MVAIVEMIGDGREGRKCKARVGEGSRFNFLSSRASFTSSLWLRTTFTYVSTFPYC